MGHLQTILLFFQLVLAVGNLSIMLVAFVKFLGKPRNDLERRVVDLELKITEIEKDLNDDNEAIEVMLHSTLALIEWEIQYCLTEHKDMSKGLEEAKTDLNKYLARR